MATITYSPTTHVSPITATVADSGNTQNIDGLSPGSCVRLLGDQWAAANVWLPTGVWADGSPAGMAPFSTSGSVTVT